MALDLSPLSSVICTFNLSDKLENSLKSERMGIEK